MSAESKEQKLFTSNIHTVTFPECSYLPVLAKQEHVTAMLNDFSMLYKQPQSLKYFWGLDLVRKKQNPKRRG